MDNPVVKEIVADAALKLNQAYGYCGMATAPEFVMLNSDDGNGNDIKITFKVEKG